MKNFIEVELSSGELITLAAEKIVYVSRTQENQAVVYLHGPVYNDGRGATLTLNMTYSNFVSLLT